MMNFAAAAGVSPGVAAGGHPQKTSAGIEG